ncbi:hypothetical protein [Paenibacillus sp. FSL K6-2859]|uniref:hypothetical protein n=1 Tax=Paenibacillus sp. FSL K6-2859 TaxID=2921482 RepID=UPI0030F5EB2B
MKKKILAGLLTVSACFALGSTSFAASAPTTNPNSTPVSNVATSQEITAKGTFEQVIVHLDSGYWKYLPGFLELVFNDGGIVLYQDGWVEAVQYGAATIKSTDEYGNITYYTILVDRK